MDPIVIQAQLDLVAAQMVVADKQYAFQIANLKSQTEKLQAQLAKAQEQK